MNDDRLDYLDATPDAMPAAAFSAAFPPAAQDVIGASSTVQRGIRFSSLARRRSIPTITFHEKRGCHVHPSRAQWIVALPRLWRVAQASVEGGSAVAAQLMPLQARMLAMGRKGADISGEKDDE